MTQQIELGDIQAGIQRILAAHDRWVSVDVPGDHVPPDDFADALADFGQIGTDPASGQRKVLPDKLQDLQLLETGLLLLVQWTQYQQQAAMYPDGLPLPADFRRAYNRLTSLYQKSLDRRDERTHTQRVQPVKELKASGATNYQIAVHYGMLQDGKYQGVFFTPHATIREDLIFRELEQPGSVITKDWTHPRDLAEQDEQAEQVQATLKTVNGLASVFFWQEEEPPEDPDTVEELLRQGQYPDVIARVKHTTEAAVIAEAKRLNIPTNWRENPNRWRYIERVEEQPIAVQQQYSSEEIIAMIHAEKDADPEANTQEIADRVNQRTGLQPPLTRQKVKVVLANG